ncbi:MAG TPA: FMN-binding protein [Thermoanaerobaculia bacterium]
MERRARVRVLRAALGAASLLLAAGALEGKVFLSQEEALRLAFPAGAAVERRTVFLTAAQQKAVQKETGSERLPGALVTCYAGTRDGRDLGTAYFDSHVVRTQAETLMVLVLPNGTIGRIEVLSFSEPEEYLPRERWYAQFSGRVLDDELAMRRGIRAVSGATLTARATTDAARRVLAIHRAIHPAAGAP